MSTGVHIKTGQCSALKIRSEKHILKFNWLQISNFCEAFVFYLEGKMFKTFQEENIDRPNKLMTFVTEAYTNKTFLV